ncbi:MAG: hypothetical protein K5898_16295 [Ruminococcus sp.]|uniref:hypothetical protein n=1 Tax=Ruminococcus sp. TaxID=41978 RepID=UPI0025D60BF6|nr:hypothetical protein [Ruminococcus sp.]MCR4796701.1 hypothetical protein [Ruminococcus sp.]
MNYKNFIAGAMAFALAACAAGCSDKKKSDDKSDSSATVETTTEELVPPTPVEATDPNAITFDDGRFDFASVKTDDKDCAKGELSVAELMGNKMLKFADDNTVPLEGKVQKIGINVTKLLGSAGAAKVRRIEFDMYAEATAEGLKRDDGEVVKAPGWIGGGGGTVTAQEKWYDFQDFSGGEYNFEASGAIHAEFKFLLADSGQCWTEEMEDANFLIMRWGVANESDMYIDNIVFYDEDDNSIPIVPASAAEDIKEKVEEKIGDIKEDIENKKEKLKAEYEKKVKEMEAAATDPKLREELKSEYEKLMEEVQNSEEYEKAAAEMEKFEAKLKQAISDTSDAEQKILDEIEKAKEQADKVNAEAQAAIEEASMQIEKVKDR